MISASPFNGLLVSGDVIDSIVKHIKGNILCSCMIRINILNYAVLIIELAKTDLQTPVTKCQVSKTEH